MTDPTTYRTLCLQAESSGSHGTYYHVLRIFPRLVRYDGRTWLYGPEGNAWHHISVRGQASYDAEGGIQGYYGYGIHITADGEDFADVERSLKVCRRWQAGLDKLAQKLGSPGDFSEWLQRLAVVMRAESYATVRPGSLGEWDRHAVEFLRDHINCGFREWSTKVLPVESTVTA